MATEKDPKEPKEPSWRTEGPAAVEEVPAEEKGWLEALLHVSALTFVQVLLNCVIMVIIYSESERSDRLYVLVALWMMFLYAVFLPIAILRFILMTKTLSFIRNVLRVLLSCVDVVSVPLLANLARQAMGTISPSPTGCGLAIFAVILGMFALGGIYWASVAEYLETRERHHFLFYATLVKTAALVVMLGSVFAIRNNTGTLDIFFPGHQLDDKVDPVVLTESVLDHFMIIVSLMHQYYDRCYKQEEKAGTNPAARV